jgi:hypothetical protein
VWMVLTVMYGRVLDILRIVKEAYSHPCSRQALGRRWGQSV